VSDINRIVAEIASGAQEQAGGLERVNGAINQMDESTQGFAAMASETSAATQRLNAASEELAALIAEFRLSQPEPDYAQAA
jgi:methyl-accepting chemotaxis protein